MYDNSRTLTVATSSAGEWRARVVAIDNVFDFGGADLTVEGNMNGMLSEARLARMTSAEYREFLGEHDSHLVRSLTFDHVVLLDRRSLSPGDNNDMIVVHRSPSLPSYKCDSRGRLVWHGYKPRRFLFRSTGFDRRLPELRDAGIWAEILQARIQQMLESGRWTNRGLETLGSEAKVLAERIGRLPSMEVSIEDRLRRLAVELRELTGEIFDLTGAPRDYTGMG